MIWNEDIFLFGHLRFEGLVHVVFGKRFHPFPPHKFIRFNAYCDVLGDLELSFEDGHRVDFSLSEFFVQFDRYLIWKELHMTISRIFEFHEQFGICILFLAVDWNSHLSIEHIVSFHKVDRNDVEFDIVVLQQTSNVVFHKFWLLFIDGVAHAIGEQEHSFLHLFICTLFPHIVYTFQNRIKNIAAFEYIIQPGFW